MRWRAHVASPTPAAARPTAQKLRGERPADEHEAAPRFDAPGAMDDVVVGDAAHAPSHLRGQAIGLALTGAYLLAVEKPGTPPSSTRANSPSPPHEAREHPWRFHASCGVAAPPRERRPHKTVTAVRPAHGWCG
ncbi:hypothetical protein EF902_30170 [Streptomyces sp. WAC05858]|nr:hypothetical protein EF902_30170 [Streptomyces sp. WAC05858]